MQTKIVRGVATEIRQDEYNRLHVYYHETCVASIGKDYVCLNSKGYRTATTKLRMNQALNQFCRSEWQVYQKNFEWFVQHKNGEIREFHDGIVLPLVVHDA